MNLCERQKCALSWLEVWRPLFELAKKMGEGGGGASVCPLA